MVNSVTPKIDAATRAKGKGKQAKRFLDKNVKPFTLNYYIGTELNSSLSSSGCSGSCRFYSRRSRRKVTQQSRKTSSGTGKLMPVFSSGARSRHWCASSDSVSHPVAQAGQPKADQKSKPSASKVKLVRINFDMPA